MGFYFEFDMLNGGEPKQNLIDLIEDKDGQIVENDPAEISNRLSQACGNDQFQIFKNE